MTDTTKPAPLAIERRDAPGVVAFTIGGELDLATGPLVEQHLTEAQSQPGVRVVLDLAALDFIDSTGLKILVGAHERAAATGGQLSLIRVPDVAHKLLQLTGLDQILDLAD